ncbi:MAG TPA: ComEC/Rec2 family competence protein [Actinomycetes bacterium]|nr:ComEC/Rec2 family competence protein [Actinomycetes bacterium]
MTTEAPDRSRPQPHDLRLVPAAVALWVATWVGLPLAARHGPLVGLAVVAPVAGLAALGWLRHLRMVGLVATAAVVGLLVAGARGSADQAGPLPGLAGERAIARVEAVVATQPHLLVGQVTGDRRMPDQVSLDVTIRLVTARGHTTRVVTPARVVAAPTGWAGLDPGDHVEANGRLALDSGHAVLLRATGPPVVVGGPPVWQRSANRIRHGLRTASAGLPPDARALLPGLVVGDTSGLPTDLRDDFRTTGLAHLLAVSGGNLAIVIGAVLWAARWCGVRGRWLVLLALTGMLAFVGVAGAEPSVLRAAVMGSIALLALFGGRRRHGLPAVAAAVLVLLLADPRLARSYGFALSVLATAGLVLLARPWGRAFSGWLERRWDHPTWARLARLLGYAVAVPLAAQVAVAPVLVLLAPQVSLVSVPANLLAAPAVPPATVLGLVAAVVSLVSAPAAAVVAGLAGLPAAWIAGVGRLGARAPLGVLPWPAGVGGALLLTAVIGAAALVVRRGGPRWWRRIRLTRRSRAVVGFTAAVVVTVGLRLPAVLSGPWPPPGWALVACDVGQGDALVLPVAAATAVVVDVGPDPAAVEDCLDGLGVDRVALLVLTHLHADHVEGLPGVLSGRRVDQVLVGPYGEPAGEARRVRAWLAAADVPVRVAVPGERWSMGATRLQVLAPSRVIDEESIANNASIVLRADSAGVRLLLTGDVEPPAQRALLDGPLRAPDVVPVDVLKVAHHGSAAQLDAVLAGVGARLAVVSVGAGNDYGHPAPSTLATLHRAGILVERTDRDGTIAVLGPRQRLRVVEH